MIHSLLKTNKCNLAKTNILKRHKASIHELWEFFKKVLGCYTKARNRRIQIKLCFPEISTEILIQKLNANIL